MKRLLSLLLGVTVTLCPLVLGAQSLTYTNDSTTQKVTIGTNIMGGNTTTITVVAYYNPSSRGASSQTIVGWGTFSGKTEVEADIAGNDSGTTSGCPFMIVPHTTTSTNTSTSCTSSTVTTTSGWNFVAYDYDDSTKIGHAYLGKPGAAVALIGTGTTGTGTHNADSAVNKYAGANTDNTGHSVGGSVALVMIYNRVLSLAELTLLQNRPRILSGIKYYSWLGYTGASDASDWSGNGLTPTVSGSPSQGTGPAVVKKFGGGPGVF